MSKTPVKSKAKIAAKVPAKRKPKPVPPPIGYTLEVTAPAGTIYAGDPVTITGTSTNLDPRKDTKYFWTSDGGAMAGSSNVAALDTKGITEGTYTVKGHVEQGPKPGQFADASVSFEVKAFYPCRAVPAKASMWNRFWDWCGGLIGLS